MPSNVVSLHKKKHLWILFMSKFFVYWFFITFSQGILRIGVILLLFYSHVMYLKMKNLEWGWGWKRPDLPNNDKMSLYLGMK